MGWKAPITADPADFTEPEAGARWSARRRLVVSAVVVALVVATLLGVAAWRSRAIPTRIQWCNREWKRGSGLNNKALPPDVAPGLPWTVAKTTPTGSFYLPLSGSPGCASDTPTVGYLHHGDQYISYELSGGP